MTIKENRRQVTVELKEQALAHYARMIKWAKRQRADDKPRSGTMHLEIGESWGAKDCAYCASFDRCLACPLYTHFGCCNGLWEAMKAATTWGEWLKCAHKIVEYIKQHG